MKRLWLVASMACIVSPAFAAPAVTNTAQKGSALVFPLVVVANNQTTYIRLANDGSQDIDVHCEYRDNQAFYHAGFVVKIIRRQAIWFDAAEGGTADTKPIPPYPGGDGTGLLVCWAVDVGDTTQIRWNHISGTANVVDFTSGAATEYPAWAFAVRAPVVDKSPIGTPGVINLDGIEYDACPRFLHGFDHDNPATPNAGPPVTGTSRVVVTPCAFDLRQDWVPFTTNLRVRGWAFAGGGASTTNFAGSDHWQDLTIPGGPSSLEIFSSTATCAPVSATQCGVVGVQYRLANVPATNTELSASGTRPGVILWDVEDDTPQ